MKPRFNTDILESYMPTFYGERVRERERDRERGGGGEKGGGNFKRKKIFI